MRGKNIVWLSMIAMLCSVMMVNMGAATPPPTKLYVDPTTAYGEIPGELSIDINIEKVNNLFAYGVTVEFAPYVSVLVVSQVTEGPFLKQAGNTIFKYKYSGFEGTVKVGCTILGASDGASGEGTLFSIKFKIAEAGDSPLNLIDTGLLDNNLNPITHNVQNGYYYGPTIDLTRMQILPGRDLTVGQTLVLNSKVKNFDSDKTLEAKVKFDLVREDGFRLSLWSGQSYVSEVRDPLYLYVNEYNEFYEWDWTNPGASVIGEPDGDYTESIVDGAMTSEYGFEDLTLNPGDVIGRVTLEGYCQYPNGYTQAVDIDTYTTRAFEWLGSLYGSPDWGWVSPRWIGADVSDVCPDLLGKDATPLNDLGVLLYNYEGNADNPIRVDALRLRVEFTGLYPLEATVYEVEPHQELELDPATWALLPVDVGQYYVTATCFYTYMGYTWIEGTKVQTRTFRVSEG